MTTFDETRALIWALFLGFYCIFVTVFYLVLGDPMVHQVSYGLLVSIAVFTPLQQVAFILIPHSLEIGIKIGKEQDGPARDYKGPQADVLDGDLELLYRLCALAG